MSNLGDHVLSWRFRLSPVDEAGRELLECLALGPFTAWLTGSLAYWLTGSLAYWLTGLLAYWLTGLLTYSGRGRQGAP